MFRFLLRVARILLVKLKLYFFLAYGYIAFGLSFLRPQRDYIEERWSGEDDLATATRVAIFNHYDRQGRIHRFVLHYLDQLRDAGYCILFASNAPKLPARSLEQLRPRCGLILRRANIGLDFGAYKDSIAELPDRSRLNSLILANDSVYGPLFPLRELLSRIDWETADVWGMADSWDRRYHLQSFFLLYGEKALKDPAFDRFWDKVRYVQSKTWIIQRYEVGQTTAMLAGGLRCRALFPYRKLVAAMLNAVRSGNLLEDKSLSKPHREFLELIFNLLNKGTPINPTHLFWDHLIGVEGFPFLKRELLRENPMHLPFITSWEEVVRNASDYDTDLIDEHLQISLKNRSV